MNKSLTYCMIRDRLTGLVALSLLVAMSAGCDHLRSQHAERKLTEAAVAMPISPGQTAAWQQALGELTGQRYAEYDASRRRFGLDTQTTYLQRTPAGDFALVYMAGPDVVDSFRRMSKSQDPWDVQWRQLTQALHGKDFSHRDAEPMVEAGFSMQEGDLAGTRPFMFMAPLGEGKRDQFQRLARSLMGERHAEYVKSRQRIGVHKESSFLQKTPRGDMVVFYWRSADPRASLAKLRDSGEPFDRWLFENVRAVHPQAPETLVRTASANTLVAQYPQAGR